MPVWLAITLGAVTIVSTVGNLIYASFSKLSKDNFAQFKLELIQIFDTKLDNFVKKSDLTMYSESHGREHKIMDEEIHKLRTFKHDVGAEIRKTGSIVEDVKEDIKEVKDDLKDIKKERE